MTSKKLKRRFTAKEKFEAVKLVMTKSRTVSEICDEYISQYNHSAEDY